MPAFADPFSGNIDRKLSHTELLQTIRIDIAAELEAIYLYDAHAAAADDPLARAVLADIRDEEVVHVGELMTLLRHLDPAVAQQLLDGEGEVKEMMAGLGLTDASGGLPEAAGPTVGSLIE